MKTLLKAEHIFKTYLKTEGNIEILKDINISISSGEIIVLSGPSGSGKSTLLNILGTLDTEYSGNITINDVHISPKNDLAYIRSLYIGFVFQFHHLLPQFTVMENLQIPLLISGNENNETVIIELLTLIGLDKRINHYPNEISGGEKQRVAVIRALINKPLLVLADEPTGNLDRENSQLLLNLISDLKTKYDQSFLIATHDHSIENMADRVLYLNDGIIQEGK